MNLSRDILTLDEFRFYEERNFPQAISELSNLLRDISFAAKLINVEVNKAGLVDILGDTGTINIQGEQVKKLDLFANNQLIGVLKRGISCAGIVSEEMDDVVVFDDEKSRQSSYIVAFDPLDGSSNIDNCISIGTIFGIYRRNSPAGGPCSVEDFKLEGKNMVAAGYVIYGSSTMFVYATKRTVNGFTLDPTIGEFYLSHPNIKCPEEGYIYSVSHSNYFHYSEGVRKYLDFIQLKNKEEEGYYTQRHVASMVADLHRNLIKGGILLNPGTTNFPKGKLRLVYECLPWAFIYEVAGGRAIDGKQRILDVPFTDLHQRTPLFIGSNSMINDLECFLKQENS
ncbi:class 1 fructose-bisphosphatase [Chitinophagaceae bacterium LB-8]|uniref:Fructose-1,6-bisphosphatase class 1 n=1 Tax=Paraflavisolibacter caeni TaxID=2982496 RepID=A0A9X2Y0J7_9BACT|nr:class 1 fructose-bisphosphatase [Paraflavisolibacter caeni]MCU7552735.1 class 1 fructose-bisphosphatase [Paraflavisolibacter caeni]